MTHALNLSILPETFAVCRLAPTTVVPPWATQGTFWAITQTDEELSIVCPQAHVPADVQHQPDWACLKVAGPLDFALTGILAGLAAPLADAHISIFALSTYDTDYLLIPATNLAQATAVLQQNGHHITNA